MNKLTLMLFLLSSLSAQAVESVDINFECRINYEMKYAYNLLPPVKIEEMIRVSIFKFGDVDLNISGKGMDSDFNINNHKDWNTRYVKDLSEASFWQIDRADQHGEKSVRTKSIFIDRVTGRLAYKEDLSKLNGEFFSGTKITGFCKKLDSKKLLF